MHIVRASKSKFYLIVSVVLLFLFAPVTLVYGDGDFGVDIDWIYYQDNSGREIDYDFSTGEMDEYGVVTIPLSAVKSVPTSESGTTFLWEPGHETQQVSLSGGVYQISIPQATDTIKPIPTASITIDGSEGDWDGVTAYLEDSLNDVGSWVQAGSGADMHYLKLAFSPDDSRLYILMKLNGTASQNTWYRLLFDTDLDGRGWGPGDYQIDIQHNGTSWNVVSQGWNSDGSWYPVDENGIVVVSGQVIEASVVTAALGLQGDVIISGRTMQNESPYQTYDTFSTNYLEAEGLCSMGGVNVAAPSPTEWEFAARISNFRNISQSQHYYTVEVGAGSWERGDLEPEVWADWFSGTYNGVTYENALIFGADIENDFEGADEYEWEWGLDNGEGLVLNGLDPLTTVLDLKFVVTNNGQTFEAFYRINSDNNADWNLLVTHTLPTEVGTIHGFCDVFPVVELGTGSVSDSGVENGYLVTSDLWIRAVINTEEKGPIEAVWKKGGEDTTSAGDRVIWGHFYASPTDVTWGSSNNPDLFVKIWFDHYGRLDVNFFHVSVPDIEVYSDYPYDGTADEYGTTTMSRRYIRQYYESGQSYSEENYEDGDPPAGYWPTGNPSGYLTINDLRIGSIINTVEKGPIDAVWRLGGQDTTSRGDQVVWGHFYASPSDVTWGSENNPDLFVKIWFDVSGRVDVNFFHVSVPDIEVYSDLPDDGDYNQKGTTVMDNRYIRHEYWR